MVLSGNLGWAVVCFESLLCVSRFMCFWPSVLFSTPMFGECLEDSFLTMSSKPCFINISIQELTPFIYIHYVCSMEVIPDLGFWFGVHPLFKHVKKSLSQTNILIVSSTVDELHVAPETVDMFDVQHIDRG